MKTSEQIQTGLALCKRNHCSKACPYHSEGACYTKLHSDAGAIIRQLENERWELFDLLSSVWYDKRTYFIQEDGWVYSRVSCNCLSLEQAIDEFARALTIARDAEAITTSQNAQ